MQGVLAEMRAYVPRTYEETLSIVLTVWLRLSVDAANHSQGRHHVGIWLLRRSSLRLGIVLAYVRGHHLGDRFTITPRILRQASQRVDRAQADIDLLGAGLLDRLGVPVADLDPWTISSIVSERSRSSQPRCARRARLRSGWPARTGRSRTSSLPAPPGLSPLLGGRAMRGIGTMAVSLGNPVSSSGDAGGGSRRRAKRLQPRPTGPP
ncbi:hypothetical protein ACIBQ1_37600 [Nonomuraea sp. NPDC050153]|uniref:hypothetical protein n=1 Tax=Nonomuraea sp. NPDC050153 TaxID=3364359 RepID=UPI00378FD502